MKSVWTALNALGKFAVLEASNEGAIAVRTVIDVQEVIVWLNVEARRLFCFIHRGNGEKKKENLSEQKLFNVLKDVI